MNNRLLLAEKNGRSGWQFGRNCPYRCSSAAVVPKASTSFPSFISDSYVACIRQLDHMTGTGYNSHRGHLRR
ncbi:hypothetical protein FZZ85_09380 [Synechococcus sp. MU1642]|nr:hypothetical protein [Synechococcus sp. MU1642]